MAAPDVRLCERTDPGDHKTSNVIDNTTVALPCGIRRNAQL